MSDKSHNPCLIERWNVTTVAPVSTHRSQEDLNALLDTVGATLERAINDVLSGLLAPHRELVPLLHALRGAHLALAGQLGVVEEWMSALMKREGVPLDYVARERDEGMDGGRTHAREHFVDGCEKCTN